MVEVSLVCVGPVDVPILSSILTIMHICLSLKHSSTSIILQINWWSQMVSQQNNIQEADRNNQQQE